MNWDDLQMDIINNHSGKFLKKKRKKIAKNIEKTLNECSAGCMQNVLKPKISAIFVSNILRNFIFIFKVAVGRKRNDVQENAQEKQQQNHVCKLVAY